MVMAARLDGRGDSLTSITLWLRAGRCSVAANVADGDSRVTSSTADAGSMVIVSSRYG